MPIHVSRLGLFIALVTFLTGCSTVPHMDGPASVPLNAVVDRVKCDLSRVVVTQIGNDPSVQFLRDWSIKAHLTLAVDNTSSVNPGATVINPLPNALPLGGSIGAVSQSFSLGLGTGLATEAVATTDLEFYLSFREIDDYSRMHRGYPICPPGSGDLLESDLQLDQLFHNALEPVKLGHLRAGNHPGIASSAPAQPTQATVKQAGDTFKSLDNFSIPQTQMLKGSDGQSISKASEGEEVRTFRAEANQIEKKTQAILKNVIEPVSAIVIESYPQCARDVTRLKYAGIIQAAAVSSEKINVDNTTLAKNADAAIGPVRTAGQNIGDTAKAVMKQLDECPKKPRPASPSVVYDPIDLISETVNFYITASGSVSPAWKLVRVSAPVAPAFATASRKYTDTLIIALGRPDPGKVASTAVTNQILTSTLRDALVSGALR